jgi:hypothetical protein
LKEDATETGETETQEESRFFGDCFMFSSFFGVLKFSEVARNKGDNKTQGEAAETADESTEGQYKKGERSVRYENVSAEETGGETTEGETKEEAEKAGT